MKPVKIAPEGHGEAALASMRLEPVAVKSRCTWITAYSGELLEILLYKKFLLFFFAFVDLINHYK